MSFTVEIQLQIAAITLAEKLNFTRAADRLKISQPALSKQIAELETILGVSVFDRNQRKVELTEAGQVFVRGCKDAMAILEKAARLARATKDEALPVLTVGHSPYADPALMSLLLGSRITLDLYTRAVSSDKRLASERQFDMVMGGSNSVPSTTQAAAA